MSELNSTTSELLKQGVNIINDEVADSVLSNTTFKEIVQGELEQGGRGTTLGYTQNMNASHIDVKMEKPLEIGARQLGAAKNGNPFSENKVFANSRTVGLDIITVIDDPVDESDIRNDMIGVQDGGRVARQIGDVVVRNINAAKIAGALQGALKYAVEESDNTGLISFTSGTDKIVDKIVAAGSKLDDGDIENGVDIFPEESRIALVRSGFKNEFYAEKGVFALGGADHAYEMLKQGGLDSDSMPTKISNGYLGQVDGVPYHFASAPIWDLACKYLGFPAGSLDDVLVLYKSSVGNAFGLMDRGVRAIPNPLGQGTRFLPAYRFGYGCLLPKSISMIVKNGFENPYQLKTIFNDNDISFGFKAPTSRKVVTPATEVGTAAKKFIIKGENAYKAAWVVGDVTNMKSFLAAYNAEATKKGTVTCAATEQTLSALSAGDDVTFCYISKDGDVAFEKATSL